MTVRADEAVVKQSGWEVRDIEQEKGLSHFGRLTVGVLAQAHHLSFTAGTQPVGVYREHLAVKVPKGCADFAQSNLQGDGVLHTAGIEQFVDGGRRR